MPVKRLRWSKIELGNFSDGRAALQVQFLDNEGNRCDWTPHWKNVEELFLKACNVESANKPDSKWVEDFANTSNLVFGQFAGLIQDAKIIEGKLSEVRNGKLVLLSERRDNVGALVDAFLGGQRQRRSPRLRLLEPVEISPSFELNEEFIRTWLGEEISCFVINGFAVRLRGQRSAAYYPPLPNQLGRFRP